MRKKWISVLLFCVITVCCQAQTAGYKFYSKLDSITTSGFYNIALIPEINAHLKTDYSDVRIINDSGKWVPHVLHFPVSEIATDAILWKLKFVVTENSKANTALLIDQGSGIISNLNVDIKNTVAERFCTLSGSDDKTNWFVINDSILLRPIVADTKTTSALRIDFPPSKYKYFKIVI